MSECKYSYKCWRHSYSQYYNDPTTDHNIIPKRSDLFFMGFATEEMSKTFQANGRTKHHGIYMDVFPTERSKYCPIVIGQSCLDCTEYKKEDRKQEKIEAVRKKGYDFSMKKFGRPPIKKDVRAYIAEQCKYKCVYCLRHVTAFHKTGARGEVDHFVPFNMGGAHEESNFVYACSTCNKSKQDNLWERGQRKGFYNESNAFFAES